MKDILITSSVLIAAIMLLRFLFHSTISRRAQYALWLLVALRLLVPFNLPAMEHNVLSVAEQTETVQNLEALRGVDSIEHTASGTVEGYERYKLMPDTPVTVAENVAPERFERMQTTLKVRDVIEPLWYGGMAAMALWFLTANLRFARMLRRTRVSLDGAESKYPVYLCDDIPSPCLLGLFRPAIYVTSEAAKDENRLRYVIAHEETHARHLDPLWSLVRSVCLVIWWFDPLVWLAAYCSKTDCELACDEGTLARLGEAARMPYGETLLALIPVRRAQNPMLTATTMTAGKRQMKDRITRIAQHKRPVAIALVLALALSGVVCAATFTGAERKNAETAESELLPPNVPQNMSGAYASVEDYLGAVRAGMTSVTYYAKVDGEGNMQEKTADVADTRGFLDMEAELPGLAPNGTLVLYSYMIELKLEEPPEDVALAGGMYATDELWYDLEGQGGHSLVVLRYDDGSVDVLFDRPNNDDRGGLYYYEEGAEQMLYDWYVREQHLDLPLYTTDLLPADENGNYPARRVDGDGWYLYVPIHWYRDGDALRWVSSYATGSIISVKYLTSEDECDLAPRSERSDWTVNTERKKLAYDDPQTHVTLTAYLYGAPDGGCWQVLTRYDWTTSLYSDERGLESGILEAMAESFTLTDGQTTHYAEMSFAPSETEVLAMRERVEAGMSEAEIKYLTEMVMGEHYWLEDKYLYRNSFREFSDPNSLSWNYFDRSGEIQIGYAYEISQAYEGKIDKDAVCVEEGLTEDEFYRRYGAKVVDPNNTHDADSFRQRMTALKASVKSGLLDEDFDRMIALCEQARETHDVGCVIELYHMLHDMDYYLLRYGPSDVGRFTVGPSIASEYYGCLSIWHMTGR